MENNGSTSRMRVYQRRIDATKRFYDANTWVNASVPVVTQGGLGFTPRSAVEI